MSLHNTILEVKKRIEGGTLRSEAAVSQGILMPILGALGWDIFNTLVVWPEFPVEGGRVDFALCHPLEKPMVIIEVKNIGKADNADEQLFRYAFHVGTPIVILTDGQDWSFYLPSGSGDYHDRRFYKLDIMERDIEECEERLFRYIAFSNVSNGSFSRYAREDYEDKFRNREIQDSLPKAWDKLVNEKNPELIKILSEKVADICGYQPYPGLVWDFLERVETGASAEKTNSTKKMPLKSVIRAKAKSLAKKLEELDFGGEEPAFKLHVKLYDKNIYSNSAVDILRKFFEQITVSQPDFAKKFMNVKHGRKRRYFAANPEDLYPGRPEFAESKAFQLQSSYWIGTNYSKATISSIVKLAAKTAGLKDGTEFSINF